MKDRIAIVLLIFVLLPATLASQQAAPHARTVFSRSAPVLAPDSSERPTYSFQISLLLADIQGDGSSEGLSKNARKALEDLRDFLPFKSYRLLDFAWLRTSSMSSARVQGPEGRDYELNLHLGGSPGQDSGQLYIAKFDLRDTSTLNLDIDSGPLRRARSLISTSFGMEEGETVVVGTSRLEGDQRALVVLLTAVPTSLSGG